VAARNSRVTPAPAGDAALAEIENLGLSYHRVPEYELNRLSHGKRVQVRDVKAYAPKHMVERYTAQMASSEFPAIVVTSDGWLVDGNTRIAAAAKRRRSTFPAIVLDVAWADASADEQNTLFALAATLNSKGGNPLSPKEQREVARRFIELGWLPAQVAKAIGVPVSRLTAIKRAVAAENKVREVGGDVIAVEKAKKLAVLGTTNALSLHSDPYRRVAELAVKADLSSADTDQLVRRVKDATSDARAAKVLDEAEHEMSDRVRQVRLTGKGKPSGPAMARQHFGFFAKYEGLEHQLVETNPDRKASYGEQLDRTIKILQRAQALS
jgi:ParB-like chromosome segregation protein Spo0J